LFCFTFVPSFVKKVITHNYHVHMKKVIIALGLLFALGTAASAQCTAGSAGTGTKSCCVGKAAAAAAADPTIEKRVTDNGEVSYVRKESDAQGNVKFVSVRYDETSAKFINVAPKTATATAGMTKKTAACTTEGTATKKCCAGGDGAKSCTKPNQ
jgi:hypothetical protein